MSDYVLGPSPADWDALQRPLALDPVTFEILRHKLEAINEEQAIALKDVSVSPIVTAASDFNNALYTHDGRIASMGPQVVFHSGAMPIVLRHVMEAFEPEEIREGDMFAVNDPYYGAVHHPDISVVAPIHHEGRLIAWAGVADCFGQMLQWGTTEDRIELARRGLDAAQRAIAIDPRLAEAHKAQALVLRFMPRAGGRRALRCAAPRCVAADPQHDPPAADGRT